MSLFGVSNVHEPGATEAIEYTVTEWLREGLLEGGAFVNVASGVLLETPRPYTAARTVYQTPRGDVVWESGVAYATAPVRASGVWVNGAFRPFGSGCVPDYVAGTVTLASGTVPAGAAVRMNYAARTVRVYNPRSAPWYHEVQWDSWDPAQPGSGAWSPDGRTRVQLPCVFVQCIPRAGRFAGLELGSLQRAHRQHVVFDIMAERPADRDRLHDAIVGQWQRRIDGVDLAALAQAGRLPLTPAGEVNPSGVGAYAAQAAAYRWSQLRVVDSDSTPAKFRNDDMPDDRPRFHRCVVRWVVECDLPSA